MPAGDSSCTQQAEHHAVWQAKGMIDICAKSLHSNSPFHDHTFAHAPLSTESST